MKLIKLKVKNFRQFYSTQELEFSNDPAKNVTLIHGENNGGKTALLNALRWCLYEQITENLLEPGKLINDHAKNNGEKKFSVTLQLHHNHKLYEVIREKSLTSPSILKIYEIKEGCYSPAAEKEPNALINSFLPEEMSEYFFYQGEGTGTLNSKNNFSHINDAIERVLGLTVANKTVGHLISVKRNYENELKKFSASNELPDAISRKQELESNIDKLGNTLVEKRESAQQAFSRFEEETTKLARFNKTAIEQDIKLRRDKEKLVSDVERQYVDILAKKSNQLSNWIKSAFSHSLSQVNLSTINTEELNKTSRYSVDKHLLKDIIENSECICGATVSDDNNAGKLIRELSKFSVDYKLKNRWMRAEELKSKLEQLSNPKQAMTDVLADIDNYIDTIDDNNREIKDLSATIKESDIKGIKDIEEEKDKAEATYKALNSEVPRLESNLKRAKTDLNDIGVRINKLLSHEPQAEKFRKLINACNEIIKLYEESIKSSKDGVDSILLRKMQILFSKVSFTGYEVANDNNPGRFKWVIIDKKGKKVAVGNGYQAMLSISFIIALIQFSNGRVNDKRHLLTPGTVAPFIADSILAFIGGDNGRELIKFIADSVEQSIFMFSQKQLDSDTYEGIKNKVGKEYSLVQHTTLTKSEFKGHYPTSLSVNGKTYDVVKFGSDHDRVTIEEVNIHG